MPDSEAIQKAIDAIRQSGIVHGKAIQAEVEKIAGEAALIGAYEALKTITTSPAVRGYALDVIENMALEIYEQIPSRYKPNEGERGSRGSRR